MFDENKVKNVEAAVGFEPWTLKSVIWGPPLYQLSYLG